MFSRIYVRYYNKYYKIGGFYDKKIFLTFLVFISLLLISCNGKNSAFYSAKNPYMINKETLEKEIASIKHS